MIKEMTNAQKKKKKMRKGGEEIIIKRCGECN